MRETLGLSLAGSLAAACLALVGVALAESRPLGLLLLAFPVGVCMLAFRGYMQQRTQRDYVEFLYESMRAAQGAPEMGLAIGQLLLSAQRLLRADYAEIILLTRAATIPSCGARAARRARRSCVPMRSPRRRTRRSSR